MEEHGLSELRIIGNLPYYITTPIIMKLLETGTGAKSITVMMQKEVGDRIAAEPGTRASGAITYPVHYYAEVTEICDVPRECFTGSRLGRAEAGPQRRAASKSCQRRDADALRQGGLFDETQDTSERTRFS